MDYKWSIDLSTLLRINKGHKIYISTKGNDTNATPYFEALVSHFSQNAVNVKRGNKYYPLLFPLKFVPYDEKTLSPTQSNSGFANSPFLHIFFLSSASVDEYRTSVRHNVSEWFATLSNKTDSQWLIVADTTRAKEKKNRSQLVDKLKSDFSKHQQRLVEVSESIEHGSFSVLVKEVQTALVAHYESLVENWEKYLRSMKESRSDSWDLLKYADEHMEFARFFWSLGCLEYALKLYDELDALCFTTLSTVSSEHSPNWVTKLPRSTKCCPKLSETVHLNSISEQYQSFLGLRHILLSQQMLITLCIYQQRVRSSGAAPSIRVDFAGILLRYASHCLQMVIEHGTLHNILPDNFQLSAWTIYLVAETFSLCNLLAPSASVDGVSAATCHLHTSRFNGFVRLSQLLLDKYSEQRTKFLAWFGKVDSALTEALQSEASFFLQVQKSYENTAAYLVQSGRTRGYLSVGKSYAKYLNRHEHSQLSLPFEINYALALVASRIKEPLGVNAVMQVLSRLDPTEDKISILTILLYLCLQNDTQYDKAEFYKFLNGNKGAQLRSLPSIECPFLIRFSQIGLPVLMPGDEYSIYLIVTSQFSFEINACHVRLLLSTISQELLCRFGLPAFQLGFDEDDQKALITCVYSEANGKKAANEQETIVFESLASGVTIVPGKNEIKLTGKVSRRGVYVFNESEVFLMEYAAGFKVPPESIASNDRTPILLVQKTPNKLDVQMPEVMVAGISQTIVILLEAGVRQDTSNEITISTKGNTKIEFLDKDKWLPNFSYFLPSMQKDERHSIKIELYCLLNGKTVVENKGFKEKIFLEWLGQVWPIELKFKPLFTLSSITTQLEANCLLETELMRPDDSIWTMCFHEAIVDVKEQGDHASNENHELAEEFSNKATISDDAPTENYPAKLLNAELSPAAPSSITAFVWSLGKGSDKTIRCCFRLTYSVISSSESESNEESTRKYVFDDEMEVIAPKVEFEIYAQMLSHHPGAQLCRAGTSCDMVINVRSLTNRIESLFVTLSADEEMWFLEERAKVLQVKESGVAQIAFTVVPCIAGLLPFPSVNVFSAHSTQKSTGDGFWSEEFTTGRSIITFQRSAGKQIRVLGGIEKAVNEKEVRENRSALRSRIEKFFD